MFCVAPPLRWAKEKSEFRFCLRRRVRGAGARIHKDRRPESPRKPEDRSYWNSDPPRRHVDSGSCGITRLRGAMPGRSLGIYGLAQNIDCQMRPNCRGSPAKFRLERALGNRATRSVPDPARRGSRRSQPTRRRSKAVYAPTEGQTGFGPSARLRYLFANWI